MPVDETDYLSEVRPRLIAFLPRLRRFCHGLAASQDDGDDLLQATVERALGSLGRWQQGSSLENWMFTIARNLNIDRFRAERARGFATDIDAEQGIAGEDVQARLEQQSDLRAAAAAFAALPLAMREVMSLVVLDGRSYREAADILDIPVGTVMSRLSRARRVIDEQVNGPPPFMVSA